MSNRCMQCGEEFGHQRGCPAEEVDHRLDIFNDISLRLGRLEQMIGDFGKRAALEKALELIENDPHRFSSRPCQTCQAVSSLIGRKFGCTRK